MHVCVFFPTGVIIPAFAHLQTIYGANILPTYLPLYKHVAIYTRITSFGEGKNFH